MPLTPSNFHETMEDFVDEKRQQGRWNYQFKAALPLFEKYDVTRAIVTEARDEAVESRDFLDELKARSSFPAWFFADKDAVLKSAEHLIDLNRLVKSPAFKMFLDHAASSEDMQAALVFTVPGHGRWVIHNMGMTYRGRVMYLHVPSSVDGALDLNIIRYNDFIKELTDG